MIYICCKILSNFAIILLISACKRKEQELPMQDSRTPKKPRLVFTDIQRRTLHAIFKETKRPSKEMQATIAQQLGLEVTTVANFFMNARRRSLDKWRDDDGNNNRESVSKTS
jgi:nuclear factor 6 (one cut domain family protein 1)